MSVNDQDFVFPETPRKFTFTDAEWDRARKAVARIRKKLAASCKHVIKAPASAKPIHRPFPTKEQADEIDRKLREAYRIAAGFGE